MKSHLFDFEPRIYRPEDIKFKNGNPYLSIILGQMALELAIKNVGSLESPIWIAWFDPREAEAQRAGTQSLVNILDEMGHAGLAITPFSSKSGLMIAEACREVNLPLLMLEGSRDLAEIREKVGEKEKVYDYHPITSQEKPKYLAFGKKIRQEIFRTIRQGRQIVLIDDVYSSGATIKAVLLGLKDILGDLYQDTLVEVVTVAREGVIKNGEPLPNIDLDQPLTFEVFIPEIIGDLKSNIEKIA